MSRGGHNSRGWIAAESLFRLDLRRLDLRGIEPGTSGTIAFRNSYSGAENSIGVLVTVSSLVLGYEIRNGQECEAVEQQIELEWRPCNFGGRRPFMHCPQCQTPVVVLYMRGGRFKCRAC